eukprot:364416-Chlamydomonas_euryale.AAC.11
MQDLHRLRRRGLTHGDRLEAPLQRRVLLNVLSVLVDGGRADALELAARERRLDQVGNVKAAAAGACRCASTHHGVHLVNHHDDVAVVPAFLKQLGDAQLHLTALLCPRNDQPHVQREDTLVPQEGWDRGAVRVGTVHDRKCKALRNGRLPHARLTQQDGDLHDACNLPAAANHRVDVSRSHSRIQVLAELLRAAHPSTVEQSMSAATKAAAAIGSQAFDCVHGQHGRQAGTGTQVAWQVGSP